MMSACLERNQCSAPIHLQGRSRMQFFFRPVPIIEGGRLISDTVDFSSRGSCFLAGLLEPNEICWTREWNLHASFQKEHSRKSILF
jgi:hypothetical protein